MTGKSEKISTPLHHPHDADDANDPNDPNDPMALAIAQAELAAQRDEVPVGAVIVNATGQVLAANGNRMREKNDPTAHAEILVLREAGEKLGNERLLDCTLYVTLEPCTMCAGAISLARLKRLYYGAADEKTGACDHGARVFHQPSCHHKPEIYGGLREKDCAELLRGFFNQKRK